MLLSFATSTCRFRSPLTFAFIITRDSSAHYYNVAHCVRSLFSSAVSVHYFRSPFPFVILTRHSCLLPSHAIVARYFCICSHAIFVTYFRSSFSLARFVRYFIKLFLLVPVALYMRSLLSHPTRARHFHNSPPN